MAPKNTPEEMASAHAWLSRVSTELGVSPGLTRELVGDLLELTKHVAHGPSRPAAPVTAFLVGLASGRDLGDADEVAEVRARIATVTELLKEYDA